uniref:Uncharacterized protein n=1 Tax=Magallana gigas TaxID=29159 RepID=A0A8W8JIS0_MAGGI
MDFNVLSFILCIGIILDSFLLLCPESIPTVSVVSRCPANVKEWASATQRKSCGQLRKIQNCSKAEDFVYQCVLNKDAEELLEVCASRFFLVDCPPGYLGRNWSDRCRYPSYGMECQKWCDCEERFCDIATDCYLPNVCSSGYMFVGSDCTEQCRYPNYGTNCQGLCNCSKEFCDIATGCFSPKDGYRAGYYGDRCINKWRYPNFGKACQKRCPMTHNTIERTVMGIIVSVSVLSSIIIVVAISVIIWRLRGTYRSNRRALHNRSQQAHQKITKATKEQPKQSSLETSNIPIERLQFP